MLIRVQVDDEPTRVVPKSSENVMGVHNELPSVVPLCGHNQIGRPLPSVVAAIQPQFHPSVVEICDDDLPVFHIKTAELIRVLSGPFPLSVSFRTRARQEAQAGQ